MSIRLVLSMLVLLASAYAQAGPSSTEKGSIFSWTVADGKRLYDVLVAKGLPANQLDLAFGAFDHLGPKITNPRYMTIVNSSALMS